MESSPAPTRPPAISPIARREHLARLGLILAAVAAVLVTAVSVWAILALRSVADQHRAAARTAEALLLNLSRAESITWQSYAEDFPDWTFQTEIKALDRTLHTESLELRRQDQTQSAADRVRVLIGFFRAGIDHVQREIALRHLNGADTTAITSVSQVLELLSGPLLQTSHRLRAQADLAESRSRIWSLAILGIALCLLFLLGWLVDRTRRARVAARREIWQRSERRMRALVQNAGEVIAILDTQARIVFVTESCQRMLGYLPDELIGREVHDLLTDGNLATAEAALARLATAGHSGEHSVWPVQHSDGRTLWVEAIGANLLHEPDIGGLVLTIRDVTERHQMQERLRHQAFHDSLTGLANRALFEDRVEHALERRRRDGGTVTVAFIDLDDFKIINDSLGHAAGDRLLRTVAGRIHACLRPSDTAARLGGDEFAVLLENVPSGEQVQQVVERLHDALTFTAELGERELQVGASIGVARSRDGTVAAEDLIRDADIALYVSKSAGKAKVTRFEPVMFEAARERLAIREDLRGAIERDEFELLYQPLVDLRTGRVHSLEALLRWHHPALGTISPASFIPIADETGLTGPIGRWVMEQACRQLARLHEAGYDKLLMGVNVSALQLAGPGFPEEVAAILAANRIAPRRLVIELTESTLVSDDRETAALLGGLRAQGVRVAVDDFGTGCSSLAYVRRLPLDSLKIDPSFVAALGEAWQDDALVRSIIELGHSLELRVIAEGIEAAVQHEVVRQAGCDYAQGYLYSAPVAAGNVAAMLSRLEPAGASGASTATVEADSGYRAAAWTSISPTSND